MNEGQVDRISGNFRLSNEEILAEFSKPVAGQRGTLWPIPELCAGQMEMLLLFKWDPLAGFSEPFTGHTGSNKGQ